MRQNIFSSYGAVFSHIKTIAGVESVKEAQDLADLIERKVIAINNCVYVVIDGITPGNTSVKNTEQRLTIGYSLILCKVDYNPTKTALPENVGEILTNIMCAMNGFIPRNETGNALVSKPFVQVQPLPFKYDSRLGFAFFPLRFSSEVVISSK